MEKNYKKPQAIVLATKNLIDIWNVDYDLQIVNQGRGFKHFWEIEFIEYTGINDKNGHKINTGNYVQAYRGSSKIGKPFLVKKGNYIYGKWVAEKVDDKHFGIENYRFGKELKVIRKGVL